MFHNCKNVIGTAKVFVNSKLLFTKLISTTSKSKKANVAEKLCPAARPVLFVGNSAAKHDSAQRYMIKYKPQEENMTNHNNKQQP